jgi:hypothetical protein
MAIGSSGAGNVGSDDVQAAENSSARIKASDTLRNLNATTNPYSFPEAL